MTDTLAEWRGAFGNDYTDRHADQDLGPRIRLWADILKWTPDCRSILEIGANAGHNLRALECLTTADLYGVEPNERAFDQLMNITGPERAFNVSAGDTGIQKQTMDMVFTCGVLIHLPPDLLKLACEEIYGIARRYIVCIEYFASEPEEKPYRGKDGMLFKRDFGEYWMSRPWSIRPVACGFAWRRLTGLDNLTWWVFSKP